MFLLYFGKDSLENKELRLLTHAAVNKGHYLQSLCLYMSMTITMVEIAQRKQRGTNLISYFQTKI